MKLSGRYGGRVTARLGDAVAWKERARKFNQLSLLGAVTARDTQAGRCHQIAAFEIRARGGRCDIEVRPARMYCTFLLHSVSWGVGTSPGSLFGRSMSGCGAR
jgi:hypothetical protein